MVFTKTLLKSAAALVLSASVAFAASHAMENPMVGGAAMFADKNIVENAVNSADHTTLVAAIKAAGLVETLLKPENKETLVKILTAHVIAGDLTKSVIKQRAGKEGFFNKQTVSGDVLTAQVKGNNLYIFDESGTLGRVTIADVKQSNGAIHVVDTVLLPK